MPVLRSILKRSASKPPSASLNPTFSFQDLGDTSLPEHLRQAISQPGGTQLPRAEEPTTSSPGDVVEQHPWSDDDDEDHQDEDNPAINLTRAFDPSARIQDHGETDRVRITDGRAAITKKVTVDLDSDDEIIKKMKDIGYKDAVVRDQLIKEGRIRYNEKSISTRYARIRKAFHKAETENLDEDLTDWHEGDDDVLKKARAKNEADLQRAINSAKERYWYETANAVHEMQRNEGDPKIRFSKHACRQRGEALDDGTAEPEFELDPDQDGRIARHRARVNEIAETKAWKNADAARKAEEKERKRLAQAAHAENLLISHMSKMEQREHKAKLAEEKARQAVLKRAEQAARRVRKARATQKLQEKRAAEARHKEATKLEREFKALERRRELRAKRQEIRDRNERKGKLAEMKLLEKKQSEKRHRETVADIVRLNMRRAISVALPAGPSPKSVTKKAETKKPSTPKPRGWPKGKKRGSINKDNVKVDKMGDPIRPLGDHDDDEGVPIKYEKRTPLRDPKSTSSNPRETLSLEQLQDIADKRKLPTTGDKQAILKRLNEADELFTYAELQAVLKARGVRCVGKKTELIHRLAADDASQLIEEPIADDTPVMAARGSKRARSPTTSEAADDPGPKSPSEPTTKKVKQANKVNEKNDTVHNDDVGGEELGFDAAIADELE